MSELRIKSRGESDLPSCELTNKAHQKFWGFKGIRTHDLRDTGAMLYELSYEASMGAGQLRVQFISVIWEHDVKFIW